MPADKLSREIADDYLRTVDPPWRGFWLSMHLVAMNLVDFAHGLSLVDQHSFAEHVSGDKNDVARWVREVVGDGVLARRLNGVTTSAEAAIIVRTRVEELKAALAA